ncbi:MAG: type II secretion system protein [Patescibacteria group bacterium]
MEDFNKRNLGFGMIEMLVGASVLSVALLAISSFFQTTLRISNATEGKAQSSYLLEEGIEAIKFMRDTNYTNNLKNLPSGTYYLTWNGATWATTSVNTYIDGGFERKFDIASVQRDGNNDIGVGTIDSNTKKITMYVAWNDRGATTTRSISTYVMNIFNN